MSQSGPQKSNNQESAKWNATDAERKVILEKLKQKFPSTQGQPANPDLVMLVGQMTLDLDAGTGFHRAAGLHSALGKDIARSSDIPTPAASLYTFFEDASKVLDSWAQAQYKVIGPVNKEEPRVDGKTNRVKPADEMLQEAEKEKEKVMSSKAMKEFKEKYFNADPPQAIIDMVLPSCHAYVEKAMKKGLSKEEAMKEFLTEVGFALYGGRLAELPKDQQEQVSRIFSLYDKSGRVDLVTLNSLLITPEKTNEDKQKNIAIKIEFDNAPKFGPGLSPKFLFGELLAAGKWGKKLSEAFDNYVPPDESKVKTLVEIAQVTIKETKDEFAQKRKAEEASKAKSTTPAPEKSPRTPEKSPRTLRGMLRLNERSPSPTNNEESGSQLRNPLLLGFGIAAKLRFRPPSPRPPEPPQVDFRSIGPSEPPQVDPRSKDKVAKLTGESVLPKPDENRLQAIAKIFSKLTKNEISSDTALAIHNHVEKMFQTRNLDFLIALEKLNPLNKNNLNPIIDEYIRIDETKEEINVASKERNRLLTEFEKWEDEKSEPSAELKKLLETARISVAKMFQGDTTLTAKIPLVPIQAVPQPVIPQKQPSTSDSSPGSESPRSSPRSLPKTAPPSTPTDVSPDHSPREFVQTNQTTESSLRIGNIDLTKRGAGVFKSPETPEERRQRILGSSAPTKGLPLPPTFTPGYSSNPLLMSSVNNHAEQKLSFGHEWSNYILNLETKGLSWKEQIRINELKNIVNGMDDNQKSDETGFISKFQSPGGKLSEVWRSDAKKVFEILDAIREGKTPTQMLQRQKEPESPRNPRAGP